MYHKYLFKCTDRFGITFPQFSKVDVNGENAAPLFKWLTDNTEFEGFGKSPIGLVLSGGVKKTDKVYRAVRTAYNEIKGKA